MTDWTFVRGPCNPALEVTEAGSVDLILTDPPYGTGKEGHSYGRRDIVRDRPTTIMGDGDLAELEASAPLLLRALNPEGLALFYMAPSERRKAEDVLSGAGFLVLQSLPWDKGAPGLSYGIRYAYEDVILAQHPDGPEDPFKEREALIVPVRHPRVRNPEHPNEKPVGLHRIFIRWALPNGGHVLDSFAGIASAGVAALLEGCTYTGMELDPQWWPVAERRLKEASDNTFGLDLFAGEAA